MYGHGFSALAAWDEYRASRKLWSGPELRDLEHATDDLQRGWTMFVAILEDAEARQAKAVDADTDVDMDTAPLSSSPDDLARSPSSAEHGFRAARSHTGRARHSSSSARSPSPPRVPENEDDRVVACLLARNTRSWMPRTPRRRSSRESDYSY